MLEKSKIRKVGRQRRVKWRSWLSTCSMVAMTTLFLGQPGRCALENLTNLLTSSATFREVSSSASMSDTLDCSDGTTVQTTCRWQNLLGNGEDILEIDLGVAVNVGSIVFSMSENSGDISFVGSFNLYADGVQCNSGQPVQNNGVVNCLVPNARIIKLESITSTDIYFSEIYVFEGPDFAQRYLSSIISLAAGTIISGAKTDTIGLGNSLEGLNVEIEYPPGTPASQKFLNVILDRVMPASIVFVTQTNLSSQDMLIRSWDAQDTTLWTDCGVFSLPNSEAFDALCDDFPSDRFMIQDQGSVSNEQSTTFSIDTIAVMPVTACSVSFEAYYNTNSAAVTHKIGTSTQLYPVDVSTTHEPSWCTFVSTGAYYFITDMTTMTLNDGVDVQLAFSAGQLSVTSVVTSLIGTSRDYYMTTDVNGDLNDMYIPMQITITLVEDLCTTSPTSLQPFTAPADQMTIIGVPLVVTFQMPWDSISLASNDFNYCGTKAIVTTDMINSISPAPHVTNFVQNGEDLELTLDTSDTSHIGRQTIEVAFSLIDYPEASTVAETFDVVFCPTSVDVNSFQIINDLSPTKTYDSIAGTFSPSVNQISTYTFDTAENCFEYISFRVFCVECNENISIFFYDDDAKTLISSFTGAAPYGAVYTDQLYVTIGNPSDSSTQQEFLLDTVIVTIAEHPCSSTTLQTQPTIYEQQTLSESVPYTISAPNSIAQADGNPAYCGPRVTTYVVKGTATDTRAYAQIIESTGDDFTFDIQAPLATEVVGTIEFTISVYLRDYTSVAAIYEFNLEFLCPVPNLMLMCTACLSTLAPSQDFYQTEPQNYAAADYDVISSDSSCLSYTGEVWDSSNAVVPYISYSIITDEITVDAYDASLVSLVGQTTPYLQIALDSSGGFQTLDIFTVAFTGPANPLCFFTVFSPASFVLYYRYGDGQVTSEVYSDPENDVSALLNDPLYCGGLALSVSDNLGNPVTEIAETHNAAAATWQFTYDGSSLGKAVIGTVLDFKVKFTLIDFTNVIPLVADLTIDVFCPEDGTFLGPAVITIVEEMPLTQIVYDVTTQVALQVDLAIFTVDTPCQNVTTSYIRNAQTLTNVAQITLHEATNQLSVYTEDEDGTLAGTTVNYVWLVDLTDGQTGVQLAHFEVEYVGLNYLPYFDPPLAALIQIYKQEVEQVWEYALPSYFDSNPNDSVSLSISSMVNVEAFMSFNEQTEAFEIENLADSNVPIGTFSLTVALSDGTAVREFPVSVIIYDFDQIAGVQDDDQTLDDDEVSEGTDVESTDQQQESDTEEDQIFTFVFDWRSAFLKKEEDMRSSGDLFKFKPPKPELSFIRATGEVVITFDQKMQLLPSLEMIKQGKIEINGETHKVFDMRVIPAEGQDPQNIQFDWIISEMTQRSIKMKLQFKSAVYVSAQMEPDILEVVFRDRYLFVSINDLAISDKPLSPPERLLSTTEDDVELDDYEGDFIVLRRELPMQLQLGGIEEQVQEAIQSATDVSQIAFASNFVLNVLLAASLQHLWSMVNTQQLIVMMPLFQIQMPGNAAVFFGHIMSIAAFDFIEFGDIIHEAFSIEATDPINDRFNSVGFESQYFLNNLGTIMVFYIIYIIFVIVLIPMLACCARYSSYIKEKSQRLKQKIFWNSFLTLLNETYMILIVSLLLNVKIFSIEATGLTVMSLLCVFMFLVAVIAPVVIIRRLYKFFDKLKEKEWELCYGAFYSDLNLKEGRKVLMMPAFFLFRRALLGMAICIVGRVFIWQALLMTGQIITQVIIIGSGVYQEPSRRRIEFFNEIMLMFVMYTIFCFTPWVSDVIVKFQLGYLACFIVGFHLAVNFFLIFCVSFYELKIKCKRKATFRRIKSERKQKEAMLNARKNIQLLRPPVPKDEVGETTKSATIIPQTGLNQLISPKTIKKVQFSPKFSDTQLLNNDDNVPTSNGVAVGKNLKFAESSLQLQKKQHLETTNYSQIEKDASYFLNGQIPGNDNQSNTEIKGVQRSQIETRYNQIADENPKQKSKPQRDVPKMRPAKRLSFAKFLQSKEETVVSRATGPVEEEKVTITAPKPPINHLSYLGSMQVAQQSGMPEPHDDDDDLVGHPWQDIVTGKPTDFANNLKSKFPSVLPQKSQFKPAGQIDLEFVNMGAFEAQEHSNQRKYYHDF